MLTLTSMITRNSRIARVLQLRQVQVHQRQGLARSSVIATAAVVATATGARRQRHMAPGHPPLVGGQGALRLWLAVVVATPCPICTISANQ